MADERPEHLHDEHSEVTVIVPPTSETKHTEPDGDEGISPADEKAIRDDQIEKDAEVVTEEIRWANLTTLLEDMNRKLEEHSAKLDSMTAKPEQEIESETVEVPAEPEPSNGAQGDHESTPPEPIKSMWNPKGSIF